MHISFSFDTDGATLSDATFLNALAESIRAMLQPQPAVGENTGTSASGSVSLTEGAGVSGEVASGANAASSPAPEKRKPGRPTKEALEARKAVEAAAMAGHAQGGAAAPTGETQAQGSGMVAGSASAGEEKPAGDTKAYTLDDVRAKLQAFTTAKTIDAGLDLLREFGASRVSEVKPEQYAEFMAKCEAA